MFKKFSLFIASLVAASALIAPATMATEIQPRTLDAAKTETAEPEIVPTFTTEVNQETESVALRFGDNAVIFDNNLVSEEGGTGLLFAFGNIMSMKTESEYGFLFGNSITYAGTTNQDLFLFGNQVTLEQAAQIHGDIFAIAAAFTLDTDLIGDVSITASEIIFKDVHIGGNANLSADKITFAGNAKISGELVYNDTAEVTGLDNVQATEINPYEGTSTDERALLGARIYSQIFSILGLFLAMFAVLFLGRNIASKVATVDDIPAVGRQLAYGLAVLFLVPLIAIFGLMSYIAAPLALIILALYVIAIYLSHGFTSLWLGHLVFAKLIKKTVNPYLETLVGLVILGICSFIPYLGGMTDFLAIVFGLGLIISQFKTIKFARKTAKKAVIAEKIKKTEKVTKE